MSILTLAVVCIPCVASGYEKPTRAIAKNCTKIVRKGPMQIFQDTTPINKNDNARNIVKPIYYIQGDSGRHSFQRYIFVSKLIDFKVRLKK